MTSTERKDLATFGRNERHRVAQASSCTVDQVRPQVIMLDHQTCCWNPRAEAAIMQGIAGCLSSLLYSLCQAVCACVLVRSSLRAQHTCAALHEATSESSSHVQVDDCIAKYQWMAYMTKQMAALKKAGKPVPQTIDDVEAQFGNVS